jgi:LAO/AO transport system kinase
MALIEAVLEGNRLALARLLTQVESDSPEGRLALAELFQHTGTAHLIGVTGAPGTGKSSLVNQLALHYRKDREKKVAIVAVDPSSPFTGGAVLGDRVRMRDLAGDEGVFIRSMASRGSLGGIAQKTAALVQVFDAAGYDLILIETVGAGQAGGRRPLAHTTVVVEAPGLGDEIQAIKAGSWKLRMCWSLTKPTVPALRTRNGRCVPRWSLLIPQSAPIAITDKHVRFTPATDAAMWIPPINKTVATEGKGIAEVAESIARHARTCVKMETGASGSPAWDPVGSVAQAGVDGPFF